MQLKPFEVQWQWLRLITAQIIRFAVVAAGNFTPSKKKKKKNQI